MHRKKKLEKNKQNAHCKEILAYLLRKIYFFAEELVFIVL